ncbi:MAG: hypothetical protein IPM35_32730 [Myxococcales bacterium]|nr:hypothetical protein [Myxococcales bacterium]
MAGISDFGSTILKGAFSFALLHRQAGRVDDEAPVAVEWRRAGLKLRVLDAAGQNAQVGDLRVVVDGQLRQGHVVLGDDLGRQLRELAHHVPGGEERRGGHAARVDLARAERVPERSEGRVGQLLRCSAGLALGEPGEHGRHAEGIAGFVVRRTQHDCGVGRVWAQHEARPRRHREQVLRHVRIGRRRLRDDGEEAAAFWRARVHVEQQDRRARVRGHDVVQAARRERAVEAEVHHRNGGKSPRLVGALHEAVHDPHRVGVRIARHLRVAVGVRAQVAGVGRVEELSRIGQVGAELEHEARARLAGLGGGVVSAARGQRERQEHRRESHRFERYAPRRRFASDRAEGRCGCHGAL